MAKSNYPSILPNSSTTLEFDLESTLFFSLDLGKWNFTDIYDPYKCPVLLLSWLAWTRHVDVFDDAWPTWKKREVIAGMPEVHLRKGSITSMRKAIRDAGFGEFILQEGKGVPLYNGVHIYDGSITYQQNIGHWAMYTITMESQISIRQAQNVRTLLNEISSARNQLIEINYLQSIIYDGQHTYNGEFSYGAD